MSNKTFDASEVYGKFGWCWEHEAGFAVPFDGYRFLYIGDEDGKVPLYMLVRFEDYDESTKHETERVAKWVLRVLNEALGSRD